MRYNRNDKIIVKDIYGSHFLFFFFCVTISPPPSCRCPWSSSKADFLGFSIYGDSSASSLVLFFGQPILMKLIFALCPSNGGESLKIYHSPIRTWFVKQLK
ncbi:hypothetical protein Dimus_028143 [Dionaea muscipula]